MKKDSAETKDIKEVEGKKSSKRELEANGKEN
jgi:hypothetical protein